jgi:type III secretory pathway component EscS
MCYAMAKTLAYAVAMLCVVSTLALAEEVMSQKWK